MAGPPQNTARIRLEGRLERLEDLSRRYDGLTEGRFNALRSEVDALRQAESEATAIREELVAWASRAQPAEAEAVKAAVTAFDLNRQRATDRLSRALKEYGIASWFPNLRWCLDNALAVMPAQGRTPMPSMIRVARYTG